MIVEQSDLVLPEKRALDDFQTIVETVREPPVIIDSDLITSRKAARRLAMLTLGDSVL